jgi:hypothetical protein
MPFPEGNYGAVLDSTPGPGKLSSGETHTIVTYTAAEDIMFGRACRLNPANLRTVVQGCGGFPAGPSSFTSTGTVESLDSSTYTGTGSRGTLAAIRAIGDVAATFTSNGPLESLTASMFTGSGTRGALTAIQAIGSTTLTFDGVNVTIDFTGAADLGTVAALLESSLRVAGGKYGSVVVTDTGTAFRFAIPTGSITSASVFTGTGADTLGLDTGTINGLTSAGTLTLMFEGGSFTITVTGVANYAAIATLIQTSMQASSVVKLDNATMTYASNAFTVDLADVTVGEITDPFTGADAERLGLDSGTITRSLTAVLMTFDGLTFGVDFTSDTTLAAVAARLQTRLRDAASGTGRYATATVVNAGSQFRIRIPEGDIPAGSTLSGVGASTLGLDTGTITGLSAPGTTLSLTWETASISISTAGFTGYSQIATAVENALQASGVARLTQAGFAWNGSDWFATLNVTFVGDVSGPFTGADASRLGLNVGVVDPAEPTATVGNYAGIAQMDRSARGASSMMYRQGDDVGVITRGEIWVYNSGTVAATVDTRVYITIDDEGRFTATTSLTNGVLYGATWVSGVPAGQLGRVRIVAAESRN